MNVDEQNESDYVHVSTWIWGGKYQGLEEEGEGGG